jgi:membrane-bound lytic murein transglycosylase D
MILKLFFLLPMLFVLTATDPYFGSPLLVPATSKSTEQDIREIPWRATDAFEVYLKDREDRVDDAFTISPFFAPMVRFWFFVYTQFESSQVVFHDKKNMGLIYKVVDFSSLHKKGLPKNTLYVLQQKITSEKVEDLKKDLQYVSKNPFSLEPRAREIYDAIKRSGVVAPIQRNKRSAFFRSLADNLRTQTGQKNFIRDGVLRSLPYQSFLSTHFKTKGLPLELTAIPFLESSFNPAAQSKVEALGAWQFMPLIASFFVPKRTDLHDYRFNVGVSSVSAAFLMAENFKILKRWDLAVTAYNSGTKHLVKTKRELAGKHIDLETVIKHSDSRHFGFASKNFYSEFLALAHTLAYREEIFKDLNDHEREDVEEELRFFLVKCNLGLEKVLSDQQLDDVKFHNHHISDFKRSIPRAFILTTKSELPKAKFYRLSDKQVLSTKPLDWEKFLKNQSCSTR